MDTDQMRWRSFTTLLCAVLSCRGDRGVLNNSRNCPQVWKWHFPDTIVLGRKSDFEDNSEVVFEK